MSIATRDWDRRGDGGLAFTALGMGTAPLGNLYRAITDDEAHAILTAAWDAGVRYYDTAPLYGYGLSETRLNRFLRDKPRDDYVLSTKVGRLLAPATPDTREGVGKWFDVPNRLGVYDYSGDAILRSVEFSLERLGVDRIDVLYIHDLDLANHGTEDAVAAHRKVLFDSGIRALSDLRDAGTIRAFGAGLNEVEPCLRLAEAADIDLFLLAGRYTLLEQGALDDLMPLCEARGIGVVIGGPYNSGILATGAREGAFYDYHPAPPEIMDRVSRIEAVCARHDVRLVDAAFTFPLAHPAVVSVIPGGQRMAEMESNLAAVRATIPPALWADLKADGLIRPDAPVPALT